MKNYSSISLLFLSLIIITCSKESDVASDAYSSVYVAPPSNTTTTTTTTSTATQFTLAVTAAEGGAVSSTGGTYDDGTSVSITATPNEGYEFVGWNGTDMSSSTITIMLTANTTIEALFTVTQYSLTVSAGEGGSVSTAGGTYNAGTEITITADEVEGYTFMGWSNDNSQDSTSITFNSATENIPYVEIQNSTTITLNSDVSIIANYESETAQSGRVEILNLSSLYKTSDIKYWIDYANTKVTNQTADILSISYDVGDFISEGGFNRPFNKFELLLKPSQIEAIMTKIGLFLENSNLINQTYYQEQRNVYMADIRDYLEGGADASSQFTLGPQTRILLMGFSTWNGGGPPVIKIPDTRRFVLHELYHGFQKNLIEQCVNDSPYRWLTEGGARYFEAAISGEISNTDGFQWLLKENYNNLAYREGTFQSSTDAAVVLRLMVERGWLDESTILDASFFDGCMEDYNDSNENFVQAMSLYTQVLKNSSDNYYFSAEALSSSTDTSTSTDVPTYSISVTASNGGTVSTEGGDFEEGTSVTITATANEGYRFTGWEGSDSTSESLTVTLNSDQTYQALFELVPVSVSVYTISVTAQGSSNYILSGDDANGSVTGNDPSVSLKVGDTLNFNVNAQGHPFYLIKTSDGGFGSSNLIDGVSNNGTVSATVSWTPTEAGTYYYICEYHPSMLGTITVTE